MRHYHGTNHRNMAKIIISQSNDSQLLLQEIVNLIEKSQSQVSVQVNSAVTMLFWQVGNTDIQIVVPLSRQLSWSHFLILLPLKNQEAKLFYAQKVMQETWGKNYESLRK